MPASVPSSWLREVGYRVRRHLALKMIGTTAWVWAFFIGYFHLLRHVEFPVTTVPLTALDAFVPLLPIAIVPYLSLWFYVGIAPGLQRTFGELFVYGIWTSILGAIGLAIFYRWPTRIPTFSVDSGGFPGFALLAGIDMPGNACPSMHVAFAVFTGIWLDVLLRECRAPRVWRGVNALWLVAIAFSTVAIRQHVVLDALAGAALGAAVAMPSLRWRGRPSMRGAARGPAAIMTPHPTQDAGSMSKSHSMPPRPIATGTRRR